MTSAERTHGVPDWLIVIVAIAAHYVAHGRAPSGVALQRFLAARGVPFEQASRIVRQGWGERIVIDGERCVGLTAAGSAELERMRGQGEVAA